MRAKIWLKVDENLYFESSPGRTGEFVGRTHEEILNQVLVVHENWSGGEREIVGKEICSLEAVISELERNHDEFFRNDDEISCWSGLGEIVDDLRATVKEILEKRGEVVVSLNEDEILVIKC